MPVRFVRAAYQFRLRVRMEKRLQYYLLVWHCVVGLVLLASAVAKVVSGVEAGSGLSYLTPSVEFRAAMLLLEVLVGVALISRFAPRLSHLASTFVFAAFVTSSGWMVSVGVTDCGCFGGFVLNPVFMLAFDSIVLVSLVYSAKFLPQENLRRARLVRGLVVPTASCLALLSSLLFAYSYACGFSLGGLSKFMAGERVLITRSSVSLAPGEPSSSEAFYVSVQNRSGVAARLVGGLDNCSIRSDVQFPISIPSDETAVVRLILSRPNEPGLIAQKYQLYAESSGLHVLPIDVSSLVVSTHSVPASNSHEM